MQEVWCHSCRWRYSVFLCRDIFLAFSVFFESVDNVEVDGGRRQLGPTSVVSRKVISGKQHVMITVVGEIPLGSAERVALSMPTELDSLDD